VNEMLYNTAIKLEKIGKRNNSRLWIKVSEMLLSPRRLRREVNVSHISKYTSEGDIVVVPGKVLGSGILTHPVTVSAYKFSQRAKEKIVKAGGNCLSLLELAEKNPNGSNIKLLG